jgi:hypothetical protein
MEAAKNLLPGRVNIISYCALRAPITGKSEMIALLRALLEPLALSLSLLSMT